jgi:tRNA A-37 threonylcarbamoyl transferase component Bud32
VLQGRYRLLSAIGDGAMGIVYRAERIGLDRHVAVKFIASAVARDPNFVKRFEVELRAMGRLSHPNCISVIDYGFEALPYMVMDLVEGTSLRALVARGSLPPARALAIACQLLAGLAHAHSKGIVHRDVKPENILLEQAVGVAGDYVRIVDFGVAKLLDAASKLTLGKALGSPHYMPPEQMSAGEIDERVDIYTTGIVLFEMLTGRKPFDGPSLGDVLLAQKQDPPPPFAEAAPRLRFSPDLERLVQRALAKSPAARFRSALEMKAAIEALPEMAGRDHLGAIVATGAEPSPGHGGPGPESSPAGPLLAHLQRAAGQLARRGQRALGVAFRHLQAVGREARARWSALPASRRRAAAMALAGVMTALFVAVALGGSGGQPRTQAPAPAPPPLARPAAPNKAPPPAQAAPAPPAEISTGEPEQAQAKRKDSAGPRRKKAGAGRQTPAKPPSRKRAPAKRVAKD